MKFTVNGQTYELLEQDRLSFGDAEDLERVTGMPLNEIDRKSRTCVCAHYLAGHPPGETLTDVRPCIVCDCPGFANIAPTVVTSATIWLSMRRENPALTFDAARQYEAGAVVFAEEPANPTDPPAVSGDDETSTS